jgi:hypothetical protein
MDYTWFNNRSPFSRGKANIPTNRRCLLHLRRATNMLVILAVA